MKKISIILAVFSFVFISSVQANLRFGAKAGVNLANASFNTETLQTSNFTGFQAGPILEFTLVGIGIDAALLYSQQGLKLKDVDFEEKMSTLDIPVNLKLKIGLLDILGGYLSAGPYMSFKLSGGNLSDTSSSIWNDFKTESFGAGINLGCGVELLKHLQVGVNYRIGLTDDYKTLEKSQLDLKGKTRIWSITAAYFF
jgi:long-subunit fatty acid transport protein